jgi:hypothetical protein
MRPSLAQRLDEAQPGLLAVPGKLRRALAQVPPRQELPVRQVAQ